MAKIKGYSRLPGKKRTSGVITTTRCALWHNDDQLLSVINEGYAETYKRFYYQDILAFIIKKTNSGFISTVVLAMLSLALVILAVVSYFLEWNIAATASIIVIALLFLGFLLIELVHGPTADTYIKTAVQMDRMPTLARVRVARKAIARLLPQITNVQVELPLPEDPETHYTERMRQTLTNFEEDATNRKKRLATTIEKKKPLKPYKSWAHLILFSILLADTCHCCLRFFLGGRTLLYAGTLIMIALVVSVAIAAIKQYATNLDGIIKGLTWASAGYIAGSFGLSIIHNVITIFANLTNQSGSLTYVDTIANASPFDSPMIMVILCYSLIGATTIALMGFHHLKSFNRRQQLPPPLHPKP